jgi:serine protease Do
VSAPRTLTTLQDELRAIAGPVRQATVAIGRDARGSGVIVAPGRVVTNAHLLRDRTVSVHFADGRVGQATVSGVDHDGDLAVLSVDTAGSAPLTWADAAPEVGSLVIAGHGNGGVSLGMVGAVGRAFRGPRGRRVDAAFEHSAPLGRGASGGPVVDVDGRLVGIDTARSQAGYRAQAVSAELLARIERLATGEDVTRPTLGIAIVPPAAARRVRAAAGLPERDGLLVRAVADDSPAATAGLTRGDLIVSAGGAAVGSVDDLHRALDTAGATIELVVVRGTEERSVTVALGA